MGPPNAHGEQEVKKDKEMRRPAQFPEGLRSRQHLDFGHLTSGTVR